jgi:hypothetical protein
MFGVRIVGLVSVDGGVDVAGVDVAGALLVGDGGDPICCAPGMRLKSGWGNGTAGRPDSASFM